MTNPKSDTLHIKRFDEYVNIPAYGQEFLLSDIVSQIGSAHDDLAHHLEQEHERNNQLEKRIERLEIYVGAMILKNGMEAGNAFSTPVSDPKGENN